MKQRCEVLRDVCIEVLQHFEAITDGLMCEFHDGLDESQVDVERFAVFEVAVREVVYQSEAEGAFGLEGSGVAVEEKQAEVKVNQVGFLG